MVVSAPQESPLKSFFSKQERETIDFFIPLTRRQFSLCSFFLEQWSV